MECHARRIWILMVLAAACARTEPRAPRQPIVSIQVDPEAGTVPVGATLKFSAQGVKVSGATEDLPDAEWSVDDRSFLSIEPSLATAVVTGLKRGETSVTVTARGVSATVSVAITEAAPAKLLISPREGTVSIGGTLELAAVMTLSDGSTEVVTPRSQWVVSDSTVASVGNDGTAKGRVIGRGPGKVTVTATIEGLSASASLTVTAATLSRIDVAPQRATLPVGTSVAFTAVAVFSDQTTSNVTEVAAWSSSDKSVLSVTTDGAQRGVARANAKGEVTLKATYQGKEGVAGVSVSAVKLRALEVAPSRVQIAKGTWAQLEATAVFEDDSRQDVTAFARWTSASPSVVELSPAVAGAVRGMDIGTGIVSAEALGFTASSRVTVTSATLSSLAIAPPTLTLPKGTDGQLTATGTYSDATSQDLTGQVVWSSSDDAMVSASNAPSTKGLVRGLATGVATVNATHSSVSTNASVTVTAAEVKSVAISPAAPSLAKGTTLSLRATATFTDGTSLDVTDQSAWTSTDHSTVSVVTIGASRGRIVGVRPGRVLVSATFAGKSGSAGVAVTPAVLSSIALSPADPSLANGTRIRFSATGLYSDLSEQDITSLATWSVSDSSLATVSNAAGSSGTLEALSPGKTTVTASLDGKSAKTTVTIIAAQLVSFTVNPGTLVLEYKGTQSLTAMAFYSDGTSLAATDLSTFVSQDPGIASVSSAAPPRGVVSAGRAGRTSITVSFGGKSAKVDVTVKAPGLTRLEVRPATVAIPAGQQTQLRVLATFADGNTQDLTATAGWTSGSAQAAVGNGANGGRVSALTVGTATITAAVGLVSATALVTVTPPAAETLTVSPSATRLPAGQKQVLTARAFYSDGTSQDVSLLSSFVSADPATVGMTGNVAVAMRAGGPVAITVRFGGLSVQAQITVSAPLLESIRLSTNGLVLQKGAGASVRATAVYSDGTTVDVTATASWSSSDLSVATVSAGNVTGIGAGKATVTVSLNGITATLPVTVQAPTLDRVVISPPNAVLRPNLIYPYKSYALYSDGTTKDVTTAAVWTANNPSIAEPYNYQGYFGVWAKGVGTATVRSTADEIEGTTLVNVSNTTLTEVQVTPARASLPVGVAIKLTGVFAYTDGWATGILNPQWRSANPAVAKVDANGVVTGVTQGATSIIMTASSQSGTFTAQASIAVSSARIQSIAATVPSAMVVGLAARVTATGTFSDGSIVDMGPSPVWSTSDASLAGIVPDTSGAKVTAKASGSIKVTASFDGVAHSASVSLSSAALSSLTMHYLQGTFPIGGTSTFRVEGAFSDGNKLDLTDSVAYDSTDPSVVMVQEDMFSAVFGQYAIGQSLGTASIRASLSGKSVSVPFTVKGPSLQSIALAVGNSAPSSTLSVPGNRNTALRAVGAYSDGSTADVTPFCTFSPAKLGPGVVATISNSVNGLVTPLSVGTETVTVTYAPSYIGQPTVRGTATLSVQ